MLNRLQKVGTEAETNKEGLGEVHMNDEYSYEYSDLSSLDECELYEDQDRYSHINGLGFSELIKKYGNIARS